jgi:broad specificity phosphatase PhoE
LQKRLLVLATLFSLTFAAAAEKPPLVTTVILVRHAEKDSEQMTGDPPLSAAGETRAKELARVLADVDVAAVYTTPYRRTEQTVAPLATALGLKPVVIRSGKTYAADVAASIRTDCLGKTVVVVGHSNTTPEVMRQLGVVDPPAIPDSQYDDLFVVTMRDGTAPTLLKLRYGAVRR